MSFAPINARPSAGNEQLGDEWFQKGRALAEAGRREEAILALDRATTANPMHGLAYILKAENVVLSGGPNEAARVSVEKGLAIRPENPRGHALYAEILAVQGQQTQAEREWRAALALRPDLVEARLGLAAALVESGRTDLAQTELEAILAQAPDHLKARMRLAELFEARAAYQPAAAQVEAAAGQIRTSAPLYRRAAALYARADDPLNAARMRTAADRLDPPTLERRLRPLRPSRFNSHDDGRVQSPSSAASSSP